MDDALSPHRLINIQSGSRLEAWHSCYKTRTQNKSFARSRVERRTASTYVIPVSLALKLYQQQNNRTYYQLKMYSFIAMEKCWRLEGAVYQILERRWIENNYFAEIGGSNDIVCSSNLSCYHVENTRHDKSA